ncbi:Hypothetical predicted protein [Marmota monax]|uniref:Uncharacterized protein n=1 Tax=Marmota monax TaxID=9995 RepID=A0A5E4BFF7_MARMO|nr:hypothetical protein GHT09_001940 [Marmota monax]VTJ68413.1 Hypothetical predicted protein [Marmota monax]
MCLEAPAASPARRSGKLGRRPSELRLEAALPSFCSSTPGKGVAPGPTAGFQGDSAPLGGRPTPASSLEGSGTELAASTALPRSPPSSPSPGLDTPPARVPSAAFSPFQGAGPAAQEWPLQGPVHWSSGELAKVSPRLCPLPTTSS